MLAIYISLSIVLLVVLIVFLILHSKKKSERIKYYTAARNTLREEYLNYSLCNHLNDCDINKKDSYKLMIYIKTKSRNRKIQYVFNPEKGIHIGRDKHESNIYVSDNTVSKKHCRIYLYNGQVCLEDLNAANGTIVKRGLFKKYNIYGNSKILLQSNDRIQIGSSIFKVILFNYDMSTI